MLAMPFGYKIMFRFKMPDGTDNGGLCYHPDALPTIFEIIRKLGGTELVIEDNTIYVDTN